MDMNLQACAWRFEAEGGSLPIRPGPGNSAGDLFRMVK